MVDQRHARPEWLMWLRWVSVTMLGWLLLGALMLLATDLGGALSNEVVLFFALTLLAGTAALQWLILRPYLVVAWQWILASCAGMVVGSMIALPLKLEDWYVMRSRFQMDEVAFGAVLGLVLGMAQWLAFRGRLQSSGWWIPGSVVGWGLGMGVGELLPLDWNRPAAGIIHTVVVALVAVAVTGLVLILLARESDTRQPQVGLEQA